MRWLLALLAALLALAGALHWASRPQRVTAAVLDGVGAALGLEITASGISEYRLRGEPRLVVRDLVARQPGASDALLRAGRLDIALPWSTLRAAGDVLEATRLEIDDAVLDLRALRRWQATRSPSDETRIPTLTRGLAVKRGTVIDDGWRIDGVSIDTPRIDPQRALEADIAGTLHAGDARAPFGFALALSRPSADAQATLQGHIEAIAPSWRLPATVRASGNLHLDAKPARIDDLRLGAVAHVTGEDADEPVPFTAGLAGRLRIDDGLRLQRAGVVLRGDGVVPALDAGGRVIGDDRLAFDLGGTLARWPDAWPALPAPLGRPRAPVPVALAYAGPIDLSGMTALRARHAGLSLDVAFELPALLAWNDTRDAGSPLPPITGRARAERVEIAGATLEGVELVIEDDASEAGRASNTDGASTEGGGAARANSANDAPPADDASNTDPAATPTAARNAAVADEPHGAAAPPPGMRVRRAPASTAPSRRETREPANGL